MWGRSGKMLFGLLIAAGLAGCGISGSDEPRLLNIRVSGGGPDEFGVVPGKPLEPPPDYAVLPTPAPGGHSLTDATPHADAITALGGAPATVARGIPATDSALLNHTRRYGSADTIRQQLAAEDLQFRRRNNGRLLERMFSVNVYFRAYRGQALDRYAELERLRRLGVRTPAAPPEPAE